MSSSTGILTSAVSATMISMNTSASPETTAGTWNMNTDRSQEIRDLRSEGYDTHTIARKLELTVPEVEEVVYGITIVDDDTLLFWAGQHH